jgi:hypothetical protein
MFSKMVSSGATTGKVGVITSNGVLELESCGHESNCTRRIFERENER